jgi:hypothetical protein
MRGAPACHAENQKQNELAHGAWSTAARCTSTNRRAKRGVQVICKNKDECLPSAAPVHAFLLIISIITIMNIVAAVL